MNDWTIWTVLLFLDEKSERLLVYRYIIYDDDDDDNKVLYSETIMGLWV